MLNLGRTGLTRDIDEAEQRFAGCHGLWRRSPGGGRWPFAGDGPWHLIRPEIGDVKGDWSETLIHTDAGKELRVRKVESRAPRSPLDRAEVGERDRVTAWLQLLPDELDRKIVWAGTELVFQERGREWKAIGRALGIGCGPDAVARRYRRGLAAIVCRLNGWPLHRARAMAA